MAKDKDVRHRREKPISARVTQSHSSASPEGKSDVRKSKQTNVLLVDTESVKRKNLVPNKSIDKVVAKKLYKLRQAFNEDLPDNEAWADGGTETPTAIGLKSTDAPEENKLEKRGSVAEALDALRVAAAGRTSELLVSNIEIAISAAHAGISIADSFSRAGVALSVPQATLDVADQALAEFAPSLTHDQRREILAAAQAITKPPVPKLNDRQLAAIKRRAAARPWSKRQRSRTSAFEWVRDNYSEWVPGLLQHHLKLDSAQLYGAFAQRLNREGVLPDWLDVPTEGEALLRATPDILTRAKILAVRLYGRDRMRGVRALKL